MGESEKSFSEASHVRHERDPDRKRSADTGQSDLCNRFGRIHDREWIPADGRTDGSRLDAD